MSSRNHAHPAFSPENVALFLPETAACRAPQSGGARIRGFADHSAWA